MADVTSICNQALAVVGTRSSIAAISEESNEARACLLKFEPTRKHLLRAAHWGFARSYGSFPLLRARYGTAEANPLQTPHATGWNAAWEPPPPWLYSYGLPGDMLAMRYIIPNPSQVQPTIPFTSAPMEQYPEMGLGFFPKYEMASGSDANSTVKKNVLLTNVSPAIMCYTADITDTNLFDESFANAFVHALGANLVTTLTGDLKLMDALTKLANSFIQEARVKSANESLTVIDLVPDWYRVRGVGPSIGTGPWVPEYGPLFGGSF